LSVVFKDAPAYLFSYFTGNGEDGLHLMYSHDGLIWRTLNNGASFLKPTVGKGKLMRDPSIVQDAKGVFHMVWTSGWTENNIGYASSKDLINWSEQKELPVMAHEPDVRNTWAPELFYHKPSKTFYIIWASTIPGRFPQTTASESDYNHRLYYTTTKDFVKFSDTNLFYDPGFNVIDAFILKQKGSFYLFMKNETLEPVEKNIRMVASKNIRKFPTTVSESLTGKEWAEGPTAIKIGKYVYLYWDKYRNKQYGAVRCKDLKEPVWENVSDNLRFPAGVRHGTAFMVKESILYDLQSLNKEE
jgi:beta-galactosidase